ncbi:MAG: transposase family protein [Gammaproteobacteria bacterium]|nr:transposase family protein [Gammaproteobacteria bacterium]
MVFPLTKISSNMIVSPSLWKHEYTPEGSSGLCYGDVTARPCLLHRDTPPQHISGRNICSEMFSITFHCDFHHSPVRVLTPGGEWRTPFLFGVLDDHSRLGCHLQWYLEETSESFTHGLCQAFMKRGLPRALMSDNGSPMIAGEVEAGLLRLSIQPVRTLAYSPHQKSKDSLNNSLVLL